MANETVSIKTFTLVKASFYLQVNNLSGFTHHLPGDEKARQGTVRDNRPMEASMVMALRPPYCNKLQTHSWRPKRTFQKPIKYVYIYIYISEKPMNFLHTGNELDANQARKQMLFRS